MLICWVLLFGLGGDLDGAAKTLIGVWSRQQPQKKEIQQDMRNQHGEILFLVAVEFIALKPYLIEKL